MLLVLDKNVDISSHVVMDAFGVTAVNTGYVSFCGSIIYPVVSHLSKKDTKETVMLTPLLLSQVAVTVRRCCSVELTGSC